MSKFIEQKFKTLEYYNALVALLSVFFLALHSFRENISFQLGMLDSPQTAITSMILFLCIFWSWSLSMVKKQNKKKIIGIISYIISSLLTGNLIGVILGYRVYKEEKHKQQYFRIKGIGIYDVGLLNSSLILLSIFILFCLTRLTVLS